MQIQMAERELLLKKNTVSMKPTAPVCVLRNRHTRFFRAGAAPQLSPVQAELAALIKEVRAQQAAMAANQAKIDEKLATLTEIVRVARIYSSRGGR